MKKWFDAYQILSDLLLEFYLKNSSKSGSLLYKKYLAVETNSKYKHWLTRTWGATRRNSIDPVHVFSSFNASSQNELDRVGILNSWIRALNGNDQFKQIAFIGCPTPISIKLLSERDEQTQLEIWQTLLDIKKNGQEGITEMMFSNIKKWYGIDIPSFSIFLFWIDAKNFLPLDKNSEKLMIEAGIIKTRPKTSYQYAQLLPEINTNLYLDIAKYGYELAIGVMTEIKRAEINKFITKLRSIYKKSHTRIHAGGEFDFKIVALRPLKGCYKKHTKVLQIEKAFYSFYKEYNFRKDGKIWHNKDYQMDLYSVSHIKINVSAIVGKNGSGKSTISELLYLAINNIAANAFKKAQIELTHEPGLNLELFYTTGTLYRLRLIGKNIFITDYQLRGDVLHPRKSRKASAIDLTELFYTIAVNYSHYGLNSLELGDWINKLFHKNDGYQTPVVINPFRKEGNVDFNNESELIKVRLFANIVQPVDPSDQHNLRVITENGRRVHKVLLTEHNTKIDKLKQTASSNNDQIFDVFLNNFHLSKRGIHARHVEYSKLYIAHKLKKICENYHPYAKYLNQKKSDLDLRKLPELLAKIELDNSHIVYKIKQVINFYRYKTQKWYPLNKPITIEKISQYIERVKSSESRKRKIKSIELLPPSFYDPQFILNDGSTFRSLSSGEKQRIYTVSSIVYHLYNLDSVSETNDLLTYPYVNITFDEVELYFHPEMQRKFVDYFLEYLKRTTFDNILALNFCFITHSPFILSDIPSNNILFLNENGTPNESLNNNKTLGGNIHDLLADSFFLDKGYMGEHANKLIKSLIAFLSGKQNLVGTEGPQVQWTPKLAKKFIDSIGEPLIRSGLEDLYLLKFDNNEIKTQYERFKNLKAKLV